MKKRLALFLVFSCLLQVAFAAETAATPTRYGLIRVDSGTKTTILALPFAAMDGTDTLPIADCVQTANLGNGATLVAKVNGTDYTWTLEGGAWVAGNVVSRSRVVNAAADGVETIPTGTCLWLTRDADDDLTKPFYITGQVPAALGSTQTIAAGSAAQPVRTLVANTKLEAVDLNSLTWTNCLVGDEIVWGSSSKAGKISFFYCPSWYKDKEVGLEGEAPEGQSEQTYKWMWIKPFINASGYLSAKWTFEGATATLPAGQGFWYINTQDNTVTVTF